MTSLQRKQLLALLAGIFLSLIILSFISGETTVLANKSENKTINNKVYLSTSTIPVAVAGVVEAVDSTTIYAETAGVITSLPNKEGSRVSVGSILSRQNTPVADAQVQLAVAEGGLTAAQQAQAVAVGQLIKDQAATRKYSANEIAQLRAVSGETRIKEMSDALLKVVEQDLLVAVTAIDYVNNNRSLFTADGLKAYDTVVADLYGKTPNYFRSGVQHSLKDSADILPLLNELKDDPETTVVEVQILSRLTSSHLKALVYLFTTAESDVFDRKSDFVTVETQSEYLSLRGEILTATQNLQAEQSRTEQVMDGVLEDAVNQKTNVSVTGLDEQIASVQSEYAEIIDKQSALVAKAAVGVAVAQQSLGVVTAPFMGVVSKVFVTVGEYIMPGQPIMTVIGTGAREMTVMVPSYLLTKVELGQPFIVKGETVGFVDRFSTITEGGSGEVIVALSAGSDLVVGTSVNGNLLITSDTDVYQVPRSYLHFSNNGAHIQYENGDQSAVEIIYDAGTQLFIKPEKVELEALRSASSISL